MKLINRRSPEIIQNGSKAQERFFITVTWINKKMFETGTRLKDISADTGIDYTQLSSLVTGDRNLSQPMKALFYFYFLSKKDA